MFSFISLLYLGLVICRNDQAEAVNVLRLDSKLFLDFQDENNEELADLIDLKNFRHEQNIIAHFGAQQNFLVLKFLRFKWKFYLQGQ